MYVKKFKAPLGPIPSMRLNIVPRWSIIKMDKEQSVAEHVFGVAKITVWLCDKLNYPEVTTNRLVMAALNHDDDEIYTGDIPSPAKVRDKESENNIIKLADVIEAFLFANAHCSDTPSMKRWLMSGIRHTIYDIINEMGISYNTISPIMEKM